MGFGIVGKAVMADASLTPEAKAIYAYLASFAGAGESSFPTRDKILSDLNLGKDRYYSHFKLLIQEGYISVQKNERLLKPELLSSGEQSEKASSRRIAGRFQSREAGFLRYPVKGLWIDIQGCHAG